VDDDVSLVATAEVAATIREPLRRALGQFPQSYSMVGLINSAMVEQAVEYRSSQPTSKSFVPVRRTANRPLNLRRRVVKSASVIDIARTI
jgi:hypothetical protein